MSKRRSIVMVDSRQPNTSVIATKLDQLIIVTTQAGVTTQGYRRLMLGIASSPNGPLSSRLDCIERLVGQLSNGVGNRDRLVSDRLVGWRGYI